MISYIMKFKSLFKTMKPPEILVLVIFVLYLIFPISTPSVLSPLIESPLGLLIIFCITISLFLYSHPILAILYIFVAYTLLRRSSMVKNSVNYVQYTKKEKEKKKEIKQQIDEGTPPTEVPRTIDLKEPVTLEEEVVSERAPIGRSEPINFLQSSYKPVSTNIIGATSV